MAPRWLAALLALAALVLLQHPTMAAAQQSRGAAASPSPTGRSPNATDYPSSLLPLATLGSGGNDTSPDPGPSPSSSPEPSPSPPAPCSVTNDTAGDMCSLLAFQAGLANGVDALPSWNASASSPCGWDKVACSADGKRVTGLDVSYSGLQGTIVNGWVLPMMLSNLTLAHNQLSGSLPSAWELPSTLAWLDASYNSLNGSALSSTSWSALPALKYLDIQNNQLSGGLPAALPASLTVLDLSDNSLSGSLAAWSLPNLLTLDLSTNRLAGSIPGDFALPSQLLSLSLADNALVGPIPSSWALPITLSACSLASNKLTGTVPAQLVPPGSQLTTLDLNSNQLSGSLPAGWNMQMLRSAAFQSNSLDGSLPSWQVPAAAQVSVLPQAGTGFCGSVPNIPEWLDASTGQPLQQNSLPVCGASPAPASPSPEPPSPSPSPQPSPSPEPSGGGTNITIIVAGVAVGALALVVVGLVVWACVRRRRRRREGLKKSSPSSMWSDEGKLTTLSQLGSNGPSKGGPLNDPFLALAIHSTTRHPGDEELLRLGGEAPAPPQPGEAVPGGAAARQQALVMAAGGRAPLGVRDVKLWYIPFESLEMQKQIGEGSFGRVYLAKWQETMVAVKVLLRVGAVEGALEDEEALGNMREQALRFSNPVLENLQKEAALMAKLRHPNVVGFFGVCPMPPSIVSEYCSRGSLADVLRSGRTSPAAAAQLDWPRRLNMLLDTAKGMLHLHSNTPPIIHRDLKSPNLLVDRHWRVKVSDFNLSKIMEDQGVMSSMCATNPRWLAPEILVGAPATFASDVYAFAVVMWEVLTWEAPWSKDNPWQVVTTVTEGGRLRIPAPQDLPGPSTSEFEGLDTYLALMQHCWAQNTCDRPSFNEVIIQLRDLLEAAVMWRKSASAQSSPSQPPRMPSPAQQPPPQQQQQQSRGERAPTPGGDRPALSPEGSLAVALGSVELSPSQQRARDQRVREWVEGAGV